MVNLIRPVAKVLLTPPNPPLLRGGKCLFLVKLPPLIRGGWGGFFNFRKRSIKEKLKVKKYVRYVDDFALFGDNQEVLAAARAEIEEYLVSLRLKIHPIKSQLFKTQHGASFLGFRIFPEKIRVRNNNLRRGRKRIKKLQEKYAQGEIEFKEVNQSIQSWLAHLKHGDTFMLRKKIFNDLVFTRN